MPPDLTRQEYERTLALLRDRRITGVVYHPLTGGAEGLDVEDWDFGPWHQPTMGVELLTDDGARFSAVWGDSFDHYGLEVFPGPIGNHLAGIGKPYGPAAVDVTRHPGWANLIHQPLTGLEIAWTDGMEGKLELPVAIRLRSARGTVWIAAGRPAEPPSDDRYRLATNDVMVLFTADLAVATGLSTLPTHP
ncbi:MAG: hypothetical protein ACJ73S_31820 [Mycobacteriales bacterium]